VLHPAPKKTLRRITSPATENKEGREQEENKGKFGICVVGTPICFSFFLSSPACLPACTNTNIFVENSNWFHAFLLPLSEAARVSAATLIAPRDQQ
jgi:hypothetical protein